MSVKVSLGVPDNKRIVSHGPVRNRKRTLLPATSPKFRSIGRTVGPRPITRPAPPAISNVHMCVQRRAMEIIERGRDDRNEKHERVLARLSLWPRLSSTAPRSAFLFCSPSASSRLSSSSPLLSSPLPSIHPFQLHALLNHISFSRQLFRY